jgi:hypothetical protein
VYVEDVERLESGRSLKLFSANEASHEASAVVVVVVAVVVVVVVGGQAIGSISGLDLQFFAIHHVLANSLAQPQVMSVRLANPCVPK